MLLIAQRVRRPRDGRDGINTFLYAHRGMRWNGAPPEDVRRPSASVLVAQTVSVPPPGNRVRSHLDILAPDHAEWGEIQRSLVACLGQAVRRAFPFEGVAGRCAFLLSMDAELAADWRAELANLLRFAQALRLATVL